MVLEEKIKQSHELEYTQRENSFDFRIDLLFTYFLQNVIKRILINVFSYETRYSFWQYE
jgi:hypothetical protein